MCGGDGGWRMEDGRGGVGGTHNNSLQPLRLLELASLFEKLQSSSLFPRSHEAFLPFFGLRPPFFF